MTVRNTPLTPATTPVRQQAWQAMETIRMLFLYCSTWDWSTRASNLMTIVPKKRNKKMKKRV